MESILSKSISRPRSRGQSHMFPCSSLCKLINGAKPNEIAITISESINKLINNSTEYSEGDLLYNK